jgi:undecaprenyl pyrophosphate phosphatase UppP
MSSETDPRSDADRLRDALLRQWQPRQSAYLAYKKEVETMLAEYEKKLTRERRFTSVMWLYVVVLTTTMLTGAGLLAVHKIEGTFMAVTAVFWFLFGALFLIIHIINRSRFEVIKEIKGIELRLAALEDRLADRSDDAGARK